MLVYAAAYNLARPFTRAQAKAIEARLAGRQPADQASPKTAKLFRRAVGILAVGISWFFIRPWIYVPLEHALDVERLFIAVRLVGAILLAYAIWDWICDSIVLHSDNLRAEKLLVPVTRKLVRFSILTIGFLLSLSVFGVDIAGVVTGLGIGGIVVALAAKDSVENVFGSITILFDMPFKLGDWVKIGTVEGVVEQINLRSTRIRTFEDTVITLPNANLIRASVENFGARRSRRQRITLKLYLGTQTQLVEQYVQDIRDYLENQPEVPKGRSIVALNDITETSIVVYVQTYFEVDTQKQELDVRERLLAFALKAARDREIGLATTSPATGVLA